MTIATRALREKLGKRFTTLLQSDPICYGRVSTATIAAMVEEAIAAGEAMARKAKEIA